MVGQLEEPRGCRGPAPAWFLQGAVVCLVLGPFFQHVLAPPGQIRQSVSAAPSLLRLQGKHCAILRRPRQTADPAKRIQLFLRVSFPFLQKAVGTTSAVKCRVEILLLLKNDTLISEFIFMDEMQRISEVARSLNSVLKVLLCL